MRASTRARCILFVLSSWSSGCMQPTNEDEGTQNPHQPGELLGLFSIAGKLGDDSCGAQSLNAPQNWSFEVKLSREGGTLYWLNGREAIVGDIDKNGSFGFETRLEVQLAPRRGAAKGCTMVRRDSASGALNASSSSLTGKLTYAYDGSADSDCSEFATGTSGLPLALPCRMTYALSGDRVSTK